MAAGTPVPLTVVGGAPGHPDAVSERYVRGSFSAESQPWLTVLPWQTGEDALFALYARHDFLVCPFTAEGFGLVVIEALSQRLPVICASSVGVAERLRHRENAWIVPPREAQALAAAMLRLWQDAGLRRTLGDAGHAQVRDWSWRRTAEATLGTYAAARAVAAGAK